MRTLFPLAFALLLPATLAQAAQPAAAPAPIRIVLVGDSTVNSGGGWGPGFCALLAPQQTCLNLARNGRSSRSYYDQGLWKNALEQHANYILIQFGHNDMPGKGPARETDPQTTYTANMRRYVEQARAAWARPVIVTSLSRRSYKDGKLVEDLAAYADAARRVARREHVPLIDLNAESTRLLKNMTQEQADQFDAVAHPDATHPGPDRTHLNPEGAVRFGRMVANDLAKVCPELAPYLHTGRLPAQAALVPALRVAADGSAPYKTIQSAINAAPAAGGALIPVAPGTCREILTIDKPNIQLRGDDNWDPAQPIPLLP